MDQPVLKYTPTKLPFWRQLRVILIGFFTLLTLAALGVMAWALVQQSAAQGKAQTTSQLESVAELKATAIDEFLYSVDVSMEQLLADTSNYDLLQRALNRDNTADEEVYSLLSSMVNTQVRIQNIDLYNPDGTIVASSETARLGQSFADHPFFGPSLDEASHYTHPLFYDEEDNEVDLVMTHRITGRDGTIIGAIAAEFNQRDLIALMAENSGLGETGVTYLVSEDGRLITRKGNNALLATYHSEGIDAAITQHQDGIGTYENLDNPPVRVIGVYRWLPEIGAALIAEVDEDQALAASQAATDNSVRLAVLIAAVAALLALIVASAATAPITAMTEAATDMASGNLSRRVSFRQRNEVGILGEAFNVMADRVQSLIAGLESRVNERTRELEIAAEVARDISASMSIDELLRRVVDLTKTNFNFYHTHIYLLDEAGEILKMEAGAGDAGRIMKEMGHSIQFNAERSLVARAARTNKAVIVNDVMGEPGHLPNPLLPETRSEMALPLTIGEQVIGVLDVQSNKVNRFTEDDARVLNTLTGQVAVAVQNARLYEQTGRSERLLRSVIDASTDWIWAKDTNFRWVLVNRAFAEQALGVSPDEAIGKTDRDFFPSQHPEGTTGLLNSARIDDEQVLAGKTIHKADDAVRFRDGSDHVLDTVQTPLYDDKGNIIGTLGVSRDVTDARRARERQITAYELSERLSALLDVAALLSETITRLSETFQYYHAHIYLLDEAQQLLIVREGLGEAGATLKGLSHSIPLGAERSLVARAARGRHPVVVNDVTADSGHLPNPLLPATRAEVALPIFTGERLIGVLDVQQDRPNYFNEDEVRTLQIVTSQLAVALSNARLYEEAQTALAETSTLYAASAQVSRAATHEDVLVGLVNASPLGEFDDASINLFDKPWGDERPSMVTLAAVWEQNGQAPRAPVGMTVAIESLPLLNLLSRDETLYIPDIASDTRFDEKVRAHFADQLGVNSTIIFPLLVGNAWIGFISAQGAYSVELTEKQIRFIEALIGQAASVTQNLRLYQEVQLALTQSRATQQLLTSVINTTPDWIWVKDRDRRYVLANEALSTRFDLAPSQMVGKTDLDLGVPAELVEGDPSRNITGSRHEDSNALFGKPSANANELFIGPDGAEFILETKRLPLYDDKARVIGTLGVATDVTERRRQQRRERLAYELGQDMAILFSPDLLLKETINTLAGELGYYHAHIYRMNETDTLLELAEGLGEAGATLKMMHHAIPIEAERSLVARAARTLEPVIVNDVTVTPDHLPNPLLPETLSEVALPLFSGQRLLGVLDVQHSVRDFFNESEVRTLRIVSAQLATALSNAELYQEQLQNAERLRELDRLKSEFLANMSHELRTPLNSVIGYSELLIDEIGPNLDEMSFEDLKAIHSSGQHLLAIINDILDLAKIEAGRLELNRTSVDLRIVAEPLAESARVLLKEKPEVELILDLPVDLPSVQADTVRLRQILWNLLSNATKFTDEGSIHVAAEVQSNELHIFVKDTGPGIDPRFHEIIFDQFRQADGSATRKKGGTGLGLAITRQLVILHGGRIWLESTPGEGTTFIFTLPLDSGAQARAEQPLAATGD